MTQMWGGPTRLCRPAPHRVRSVHAQDVGDEHEGRAAGDAGLRDAALAVAELGGDGQQDAVAHALADEALVVHLGMSGQLLVRDEPGGESDSESGNDSEARAAFDAEPRHLRVALELGPAGAFGCTGAGQKLLFVDQRIFGGMFLSPLVPDVPAAAGETSLGEMPERFLVPEAVKHIARDPLDEFFDPAAVRRKFLRTSSGIKKVLLDQSVISGVGNIYADEALWRARLHYAKPARTLSAAQTRELLEAVTDVLRESLAAGGTSFDALYVNVLGESGYFERSLNAYGRAGEPCHRCAEAGRTSLMVREPFQNRSSYRCPHCQRAPRSR